MADKEARRAAYVADVTYGACDDFVIDHLRDSLATSVAQHVQHGHTMAVVDEADLLLVDHPLTPSMISGRMTDDEDHMLALVTERGYLLLYDRLCGLSAAVAPAATALERWFGLDVVRIPLDRPSMRVDHPDVLYFDLEDQMSALSRLIDDPQARGRPTIIYAPEPHQPEAVQRLLDDRGIEHAVLDGLPDLATATREMGRFGRWGRVSVLQHVPRDADVPLGRVTSNRVESPSPEVDERRKVIDAGGLLVIGLTRHNHDAADRPASLRAGRPARRAGGDPVPRAVRRRGPRGHGRRSRRDAPPASSAQRGRRGLAVGRCHPVHRIGAMGSGSRVGRLDGSVHRTRRLRHRTRERLPRSSSLGDARLRRRRGRRVGTPPKQRRRHDRAALVPRRRGARHVGPPRRRPGPVGHRRPVGSSTHAAEGPDRDPG